MKSYTISSVNSLGYLTITWENVQEQESSCLTSDASVRDDADASRCAYIISSHFFQRRDEKICIRNFHTSSN